MDLSWHAVRSRMQVRTAEIKDLPPHGFQKKSTHTHHNPLKKNPVLGRSTHPLLKFTCFSGIFKQEYFDPTFC